MVDDTQRASLTELSFRVRDHFDSIEQDVPDSSFLVGGAVRDALLGLESNDLDFVVVGETAESMVDRGFEDIEASSFPVFHDSDHQEWALARTEEKTGDGYRGFEVSTDSVSLSEDLKRRDLRMNAMALFPFTPNVLHDDDMIYSDRLNPVWAVHDPHDGVEDLENGVLRHTSDAFAEDPLRALRCARYAARFAVPTDEAVLSGSTTWNHSTHKFVFDDGSRSGFRVADETMDMMRQVAPELNRMSRDRIGDEFKKAMEQSRRPSRFFEVLRDSGALAVLWPELDRGAVIKAGPERHHEEGSTLDHTLMCIDRMDRLCRERNIDGRDRVRRLFAILGHDIGKVIVHDR